jgi:hypothetical protein
VFDWYGGGPSLVDRGVTLGGHVWFWSCVSGGSSGCVLSRLVHV